MDPYTRFAVTNYVQYWMEYRSYELGLCVSFLGTGVALLALSADGSGDRAALVYLVTVSIDS